MLVFCLGLLLYHPDIRSSRCCEHPYICIFIGELCDIVICQAWKILGEMPVVNNFTPGSHCCNRMLATPISLKVLIVYTFFVLFY